MEKFVHENSQIFDTIANTNDVTTLLNYFQSILNLLKKEVKSEVLPSVHEDYAKAIKCLKQYDEESSLHYVDLAVKGLQIAIGESGYQGAEYDFVIFLLAGLLAAKFGIYEGTIGYWTWLDEGILKQKMMMSQETFLKLVVGKAENLLVIKNDNLDGWLVGMVGYWCNIVQTPIWRIKNKDDLEKFKGMYARLGDTHLHLKRGTLCDMMRFEFSQLLHFILENLIMHDTSGRLTLRLKGKKVNEELEKKLNSLDAFIGELNLMDIGCFGFQILLTSGVCYQRLQNYSAAALSFERARSILDVLEDPFKRCFEEIKFADCELYCKSRLPLSSPMVASLEIDEASQSSCVEKKENASQSKNISTDTNAENMDMEAETPKCNTNEEEDAETLEELLNEGQREEREEIITKDSRFDWTITKWVEGDLKGSSCSYVERSMFCHEEEDESRDYEKGTLLRYVDRSRASDDLKILNEIENLCPEGGAFILRAKSPIFSQVVKKDGVEIEVFDFVIEHAIPFGTWLEERREVFLKEVGNHSKIEWWNFIKTDVKRIFRGVTKGLCVLSSLRHSCLGLSGRAIFVCNSQGKIKPCAESCDFQSLRRKTDSTDLDDLRELLYSIIVYPFRTVGERVDTIVKGGKTGGEYLLDLEMQYFFRLACRKFSWSVKFDFLIDSPFFWTREERVGFLFKFNELIERSLIPTFSINNMVSDGNHDNWWYAIEKLVGSYGEDDVLGAVYRSPRSRNTSLTRYHSRICAVRYAVNVLKHYNDDDYLYLRPKLLKPVEIEPLLRRHIPDLYCFLIHGLFITANSGEWSDSDRRVCMKELLSRFRKGECDRGCSPYMVCDHLLC